MKVDYTVAKQFPGYRVGDDGSVWSKRRKKGGEWTKIGSYQDKRGRRSITLYDKEGKKHTRFLHEWVLLAFKGRPKGDDWIAKHHNGDRGDNSVKNLYWEKRDRSTENKARGEGHGRSRLFNADVRRIKRRLEEGERCSLIAREMDLGEKTVRDIRDGRTWRHVT